MSLQGYVEGKFSGLSEDELLVYINRIALIIDNIKDDSNVEGSYTKEEALEKITKLIKA